MDFEPTPAVIGALLSGLRIAGELRKPGECRVSVLGQVSRPCMLGLSLILAVGFPGERIVRTHLAVSLEASGGAVSRRVPVPGDQSGWSLSLSRGLHSSDSPSPCRHLDARTGISFPWFLRYRQSLVSCLSGPHGLSRFCPMLGVADPQPVLTLAFQAERTVALKSVGSGGRVKASCGMLMATPREPPGPPPARPSRLARPLATVPSVSLAGPALLRGHPPPGGLPRCRVTGLWHVFPNPPPWCSRGRKAPGPKTWLHLLPASRPFWPARSDPLFCESQLPSARGCTEWKLQGFILELTLLGGLLTPLGLEQLPFGNALMFYYMIMCRWLGHPQLCPGLSPGFYMLTARFPKCRDDSV